MPPAALGFHVVYIWAPIEGRITRVFSAQWRPFHVVTFRYGPWTDLLLSGSGGPMMDAPTYPIELDYEEYILWLEDISRHDYVRELLAFSASRAQPFKLNELGHSLIGYSTVRSGTPREKPSGLYVRRAFVLRIYDDRSFQPNGTYRDNAPSEAVDPRTVAPGRPGLKTERVTGGGQRAPRPTQEMSGRDGTD
jgi:hypothetical protein